MSSYRRRTTRNPIAPTRVRLTGGAFAFIPSRVLHDGFLSSLTMDERALYLFLVLAGDRQGVSWYSYHRICSTLAIRLDQYIAARQGLIAKDLVAFDGTLYQVLSLPARPVQPARLPSDPGSDCIGARRDPSSTKTLAACAKPSVQVSPPPVRAGTEPEGGEVLDPSDRVAIRRLIRDFLDNNK